jgi:outer membrane protein OmpA-like peptidoglycan-associated protein
MTRGRGLRIAPRERPWRALLPRRTRAVHGAVTAAALVGAAALVAPAASQAAPSFAGVEVRAGLTFPQDAHLAARIFGELDMGHVWRPPLRALVGLSLYEANIDREGGGNEGFFRATGLWLSGRYDLVPRRDLAPYVRLGLTLQHVSADAFDRDVGALLSGVYIGTAAGLGARYLLDDRGRLSATAELRRTALSNVGNTALELGVRMQRFGLTAYEPVWLARADRRPVPAAAPPMAPAARAAAADTAAVRRLAELERQALEAERAVAAAREGGRGPLPVAPDPGATRGVAGPVAAEAMLRQGLTRAGAAMESVVGVVETGSHFLVTIGEGVFPVGSAALTGAARNEIRVLATVLAGYPGHIVSVEGHTDSLGSAAANQGLSERRATTVRAALIAEGVDPLWVGSRGLGQERPIASNQTAAGRAANRRVEIRVSKAVCPSPPLPGPGGALECRL